MPLTEADQRRVDEAEAEAEAAGSNQILLRVPPESQKMGSFTVMCLILNRTIGKTMSYREIRFHCIDHLEGSGIYVSPAIVLQATNSTGVSLFLWTLGAIFGVSGVLVWLELGLSIPKFQPPEQALEPQREGEGAFESVPRSGGEKNYLEYIYKDPQFRTTCMYGLVFVVLGNLAGNAIAFGMYVMEAAGIPGHAPAIRGLAIAALTVACLLHAAWRRGGIIVNNVLAVIKALTLVAIIGIGFAAAAGASFGNGPVGKMTVTNNLDVDKSFSRPSGRVANYSGSILFVIYSYSGFKQPFYVLSEVSEPKKRFPRAAIGTMLLAGILFILTNVAYLCAVSKDQVLASKLDMATVFFENLFGNERQEAIKQEIAKEGILPFSLFFARSTVTPYAWLKKRFRFSRVDEPLEQSPAAALFLHWIFSIIMVAATASTPPSVAYRVLVSLYAYTLVVLVGFFVATGVLVLRLRKRKDWTNNLGFSPWGGPTAAIIYSSICAFLLITLFLTPSTSSPFAFSATGVQHYVVPTVGLGTLLLGYSYYIIFSKLIPWWRKKVLIVEREPIIVRQGGRQDGEWVQIMEVVEFWWAARQPATKEA
ncbi:MAG: hypothetical protein Q9217_006728 [Psora testacea]